MLNSLTIARRTEVRRVRSLALLALVTAMALGFAAAVLGLWFHCLPAVFIAPVAFPMVQSLRKRVRSASRALRLLGA